MSKMSKYKPENPTWKSNITGQNLNTCIVKLLQCILTVKFLVLVLTALFT